MSTPFGPICLINIRNANSSPSSGASGPTHKYGLGHPMKPHRIRITHDLVTVYGVLDKMHILVSEEFPVYTRLALIILAQRPKRATPEVTTNTSISCMELPQRQRRNLSIQELDVSPPKFSFSIVELDF